MKEYVIRNYPDHGMDMNCVPRSICAKRARVLRKKGIRIRYTQNDQRYWEMPISQFKRFAKP